MCPVLDSLSTAVDAVAGLPAPAGLGAGDVLAAQALTAHAPKDPTVASNEPVAGNGTLFASSGCWVVEAVHRRLPPTPSSLFTATRQL